MNKPFSIAAYVLSALTLVAVSATAQPLPQIQLRPAFPALQLERPVWMSEAPDGSGRLFFIGQAGSIVIVKKGGTGSDAKEFFNIENRNPYFDNEDGLLSIAFHPGFKTNGLFYVFYTQQNPATQRTAPQNYMFRSVISEFKVSSTNADQADMSSERILFEVPGPFFNHKGGELAFGPDGYLYIALGDGGLGGDPFGSGQSTSTLLAKMLRIDVNTRGTTGSGFRIQQLPYGIPSDNPFAKESNVQSPARKEIFAYGLRNAWRYSFDKETGDLWAGDVGQELWEEVDIVTNGGNYGWSVREATHHYKPGPAGAQYSEPVMEYAHNDSIRSQGMFPDHSSGLCIVGGYVYRGKKFPALEGVYVYGDYNLGTIWGLRYDRAAHKVTAEGTLLAQRNNIFSFAEDADGELYVLTQRGTIYTIAPQ